MEKAKRKRGELPAQTNWFKPVLVDFVTDLPLDECALRLEGLQRKGFFTNPKVYVTVSVADGDTYQFHIKRTGNKYPKHEASGYLQRWAGTSTRVMCEVWTDSLNYWGLLLGVPFMCVFFTLASAKDMGFMLLSIPIMAVVLVWSLYDTSRKPHELAAIIEDTLSW